MARHFRLPVGKASQHQLMFYRIGSGSFARHSATLLPLHPPLGRRSGNFATNHRYQNLQYTKHCRVFPPRLAAKFPVALFLLLGAVLLPALFYKNPRKYIQYLLRFLHHQAKNLSAQIIRNLCAVLP